MNAAWFNLYSTVVAVDGKERGALYDLDRGQASLVAPVALRLIKMARKKPLPQIYREVSRYCPDAKAFFINMADHGLGFFTREPQRFLPMPMKWHGSSPLQQALVDLDNCTHIQQLPALLTQLDELLCQHLEVRVCLRNEKRSLLHTVLQQARGLSFRSIHLVLNYVDGENPAIWHTAYPYLTRITYLQAPSNFRLDKPHLKIRYLSEPKGEVKNQGSFPLIVNRHFFCESLHHNPFYNRKIVVDKLGFIRNGLGHPRHFGHISTRSIREVIKDPEFTRLWHIGVDRITNVRCHPLRYAMLITDVPEPTDNDDSYTLPGRVL